MLGIRGMSCLLLQALSTYKREMGRNGKQDKRFFKHSVVCHCLNLALIYASVIVSNDTCCYFHKWANKSLNSGQQYLGKNPFLLVIACFAFLNYHQEEYKF